MTGGLAGDRRSDVAGADRGGVMGHLPPTDPLSRTERDGVTLTYPDRAAFED